MSARLLGRDYVISDIDSTYVDIANRNLEKIRQDRGESRYVRPSVRKDSGSSVPKRTVEVEYIELCRRQGKIVEGKDLPAEVSSLLSEYTGSFMKLKNLCRRKLEAERLVK